MDNDEKINDMMWFYRLPFSAATYKNERNQLGIDGNCSTKNLCLKAFYGFERTRIQMEYDFSSFFFPVRQNRIFAVPHLSRARSDNTYYYRMMGEKNDSMSGQSEKNESLLTALSVK